MKYRLFENKNRKVIEAFEMWCHKKMKKTIWTDRMTNEEIFIKKCLVEKITMEKYKGKEKRVN